MVKPINQVINEILMEYWEFEFDMISNGQQAFDLAKTNEGIQNYTTF